jgi:hypothetical protein
MIALGDLLGGEERLDVFSAHDRHKGLLHEKKGKPLAQMRI